MKTQIFSKNELTDEALKKAAGLLKDSKVIAFPTETVYGIGAHVFKADAIEKIYTLKNRPKNKGLIVHLGKIEDVKKVAIDIPKEFYILAKAFFPGPLTIVLKKKSQVPSIASNDSTIAVRMPDCEYTIKLINFVGNPIVGTSANISNEASPKSADDVIKSFENRLAAIIDAGICAIKIPSTIISLLDSPFQIIREGSISKEQIAKVLNI